jgi:hypothetical protein
MGNFQDILTRLGVVKNPVLFSSSSFSFGMLYFSHEYLLAPSSIPLYTGVFMHVLATIIFLIGIGFYIFAFLQLPASIQEAIFLQEGKAQVERHKKSTRRDRSRKSSPRV